MEFLLNLFCPNSQLKRITPDNDKIKYTDKIQSTLMEIMYNLKNNADDVNIETDIKSVQQQINALDNDQKKKKYKIKLDSIKSYRHSTSLSKGEQLTVKDTSAIGDASTTVEETSPEDKTKLVLSQQHKKILRQYDQKSIEDCQSFINYIKEFIQEMTAKNLFWTFELIKRTNFKLTEDNESYMKDNYYKQKKEDPFDKHSPKYTVEPPQYEHHELLRKINTESFKRVYQQILPQIQSKLLNDINTYKEIRGESEEFKFDSLENLLNDYITFKITLARSYYFYFNKTIDQKYLTPWPSIFKFLIKKAEELKNKKKNELKN